MSYYPTTPPPIPQVPLPGYPMPPILPVKGKRQFSVFTAMLLTPFFVGRVYRDVARNWGGIGFGYLLLLELITWIGMLVKIHIGFAAFVRHDLPPILHDFPPITISRGHVTSPVEQPYFMKDPQTGKTMLALDTTGKLKSMDDVDAMVLITDNKVWTHQSDGRNEIREYDLSKTNYFYIDGPKISGWADTTTHWLAVGLLPIVLVWCVICRLVQALLYGAINMGFGAMFNTRMSYATAMRLAIVSVTPIILINTILDLSGVDIPYWWIPGIIISLLYMGVAVYANRTPVPPAMSPRGFPVGMVRNQVQYQSHNQSPYQPPLG